MQNAECKMQKLRASVFCILHFAFCIRAKNEKAPVPGSPSREPLRRASRHHVGALVDPDSGGHTKCKMQNAKCKNCARAFFAFCILHSAFAPKTKRLPFPGA